MQTLVAVPAYTFQSTATAPIKERTNLRAAVQCVTICRRKTAMSGRATARQNRAHLLLVSFRRLLKKGNYVERVGAGAPACLAG